ncbi:type II toxin-antitoxin system VapC family toxin [Kamptonema sp. UHCC 0994]|uniref:type II toxin-antitoxin system VapC family toxin n=1 Tax=Kamptonema sp. UHCC 0994 TaxID=3031329 RepID=UPI0023B8BA42|nr:type II toxin-antitoxin system VapC family toxin [Kamptonema sp. UHCC 0994]MDF0555831.1 type II toxin-antitoxin system VapC family toxin [Kamptonema sp. UHCC 0994]
MSLWVLDTDHVSLFQQNHPIVSSRITAVNSEEIAVTVITVEEQFYGRLNQIRRAKSADAILSAYARLRATLNYFKTVNLLDFDQEAYNCYTELVRQKVRIGTQDLRIAACVISRHGVLVTRNRRDFERVPGLRFEDWTI